MITNMNAKLRLFPIYARVPDRLQAVTAANLVVQISINNTIWFQIKRASKCEQAHLASQMQSTDGYTAGQ